MKTGDSSFEHLALFRPNRRYMKIFSEKPIIKSGSGNVRRNNFYKKRQNLEFICTYRNSTSSKSKAGPWHKQASKSGKLVSGNLYLKWPRSLTSRFCTYCRQPGAPKIRCEQNLNTWPNFPLHNPESNAFYVCIYIYMYLNLISGVFNALAFVDWLLYIYIYAPCKVNYKPLASAQWSFQPRFINLHSSICFLHGSTVRINRLPCTKPAWAKLSWETTTKLKHMDCPALFFLRLSTNTDLLKSDPIFMFLAPKKEWPEQHGASLGTGTRHIDSPVSCQDTSKKHR